MDTLDSAIAKKGAFRVVTHLAKFEMEVGNKTGEGPQARRQNGEALLSFLLSAVFGWNLMYRLRPLPIPGTSPAFLMRGSAKTAAAVEDYQRQVAELKLASADQLNELRVTAAVLRQIQLRSSAPRSDSDSHLHILPTGADSYAHLATRRSAPLSPLLPRLPAGRFR